MEEALLMNFGFVVYKELVYGDQLIAMILLNLFNFSSLLYLNWAFYSFLNLVQELFH